MGRLHAKLAERQSSSGADPTTWDDFGMQCALPPQTPRKQRLQDARFGSARKLPPRASLAAHLRSGGSTEPTKHPSGCRKAQAVWRAHRSRSSENPTWPDGFTCLRVYLFTCLLDYLLACLLVCSLACLCLLTYSLGHTMQAKEKLLAS